MKKGFVFLCLLLLILPLQAAQNFTIEHRINSKYPEQQRTFTVHLPKSYYRNEGFKYPLLILLDGESNLDYTSSVAGFLAENALSPEVITVALHAGATRMRDYLPENPQEGARMTGQADQFLEYITRELIPQVEEKYRAAPLRLLSGHSFGGVFVIHAMLTQPDLFQGYMAQSPYLDQSLGALMAQRFQAFIEQAPELDKFYYMNLGDEPNLEQGFNSIRNLLETSAPQGLRWEAVRDAGETHMTTRLLGQYHGLQDFFSDDWPLSQQQIVTGKFAGVKAHIDGLSEKYHYPVLYSEQTLAQATQIFLSQQDTDSGIKTGEVYIAQYPQSPTSHFLLANAFLISGNAEQAAAEVATAIELYEANPEPRLAALYAGMQQLQQRLGAN